MKSLLLGATFGAFLLAFSYAQAQSTAARRFDFGAPSALQSSYQAADAANFDAARSFGWVRGANLVLSDRETPDALRRDFVLGKTPATFRVTGLSPGLYTLRVVSGDAIYSDHKTHVKVEGVPEMPLLEPQNGEFTTLTATVNCTAICDIVFDSPTQNWIVNALSLEPATQILAPTVTNERFPTTDVKYPVVRYGEARRNFKSPAIEATIAQFKAKVNDEELGWLFENCFPNTLDTTVKVENKDGRPFTYVITGDIDAMWLRDSSAQVWPYLAFMKQDPSLQTLVVGVIKQQTAFILKDPYANAFYDDPNRTSPWKNDKTEMKPGVHERKWEIDSLCYPIRLGYHYWKTTGDTAPFDEKWHQAIQATLRVFREQQRKESLGPYSFHRGPDIYLKNGGYGTPVKPIGLIYSAFRPSDDETTYGFLIPSNFFAVVSLRQAATMCEKIPKDEKLAKELRALAHEVETALRKYAVVQHPKYGPIYAYEIDGLGGVKLMDDANVPSLLSLPYLGAVKPKDPIYLNTRRFVLSSDNPYFFRGTAAEGVGGPHVGPDMIWPMAITMRALTSQDNREIAECIQMLKRTHGGTGFMHESFHKDDPSRFTRSSFAWANTLFGELLWKTAQEKPALLNQR